MSLASCTAPVVQSLELPTLINAGPITTTPAFLDGRVPAFPGAEGFGAFTRGGRGGRVIEVTSLDDSGPGSLRAAIEDEGPRTIVFRVSGVIQLERKLVIKNPYITIAGQSAPGGGVAIKTAADNPYASLEIDTHDVVIRYLRLRPGPSTQLSHSVDALTINSGYNIIIDHCSLSWATDEVASTWYGSRDITFQWNIFSEGLYNSTHEKGPHSMGLLLGSDGAGSISVHHNLFAHNRSRNPRIKVTNDTVDVVNNVIYNSKFDEDGWGPSHVSDDYGKQQVNYVANVIKVGPNGSIPGYYTSVSSAEYGADVFLQDNVIISSDGEDLIASGKASISRDPDYVASARQDAPRVTTTDPYRAFEDVLAQAGAILPSRDAVDVRVVGDVLNGTGGWIDNPEEVGGWPQLDVGPLTEDGDHDGMPDAWEEDYGFDTMNPADGNGDNDGDGYTNVEEYLNQTVP